MVNHRILVMLLLSVCVEMEDLQLIANAAACMRLMAKLTEMCCKMLDVICV